MPGIYYFAYLTDKVYEGGMARNYAFFIRFKSITKNIYHVYNKNKIRRVLFFFRAVLLMTFAREKKIFLHQGSILILFPISLFGYKLFRKVFFVFLKYVSKKNKLFIEVNDLPHEQAIDLQLEVKKEYIIFEDLIYSLKDTNYIFASNFMRDFVCSKYKIDLSFTQVLINGGPRLIAENAMIHDVFKQTNKIKIIYAGSLNEGRNIRDLISLFEKKNDLFLILIGTDGNWLKDCSLSDNIFYLGNFEEHEAHRIASLCDIGLLPYDNTKFYYNLCYPTKVSFYITAGIPVLSTPLKELQNVFKDSKSIEFVIFNEWKNYLDGIDDFKLEVMRDAAESQATDFQWATLLDSLEL
ncbi:hypothetical protein NLG42_01560 [Flavobacterium plurextorum]|uniref:glycosyltransferase n=1 Tax=Flavobacterium TaxID=237 RepID=UPI00214D4040|nr:MULTISPECIES: glycosyltransferase [Flavobacterium]UUW09498.1 hypothetical protein NLG42_01560 [Flavobacterium plurextorum]